MDSFGGLLEVRYWLLSVKLSGYLMPLRLSEFTVAWPVFNGNCEFIGVTRNTNYFY